jgi:hypothetical protein
VAAEIKAIWEGFSRFSKRELRLEPDTLVSAWFEPALAAANTIPRVPRIMSPLQRALGLLPYSFGLA